MQLLYFPFLYYSSTFILFVRFDYNLSPFEILRRLYKKSIHRVKFLHNFSRSDNLSIYHLYERLSASVCREAESLFATDPEIFQASSKRDRRQVSAAFPCADES